jgi:uncharacterized protein (TIGR02996 family)
VSDRVALLAAICAHPDDDTPRLVYADWLDEHGEGKRAAHIRAQVEHHRLSTADTVVALLDGLLMDGVVDGTERIDWGAVDADLGAYAVARRAAEKRPFNLTLKGEGVPRVRGVTYYADWRGFYDAVTIDNAASFLKHADAIFRAAPITNLTFWELTAEQASEFVAAGHLARIRALDFETNVEPDAIRIFGTHPDAAGVRRLDLYGGDEAADSVDALAAGKHWTGLESLYLDALEESDDPPDELQVAALFVRPQFRNLQSLFAWYSQVGDAAVKAITKKLTGLRRLDLIGNPISERGWTALATAKTLRNLRHLDLSGCETEDADPAPLVTTANLPNLCALELGGNSLSGPDPKVLARPGRGPGLRVLNLSNSALSAAGVEALASCPAVRGVWHLNLEGAGLGDDHLERFTRRAAFERLTYLHLGSNGLTSRGAKLLAQWPGAAHLQGLDVSRNAIGESGTKALIASPYLKELKHLRASGRGTAILKKHFKKVFA